MRTQLITAINYGLPEKSAELQKWYAREPIGHRRTNITFDKLGDSITAFALLFRDFRRSDEQARLSTSSLNKKQPKHTP